MKIQDAVSRLSYTISKGHKPNETDKLAFNKIIHDLNANAKETVNEYYLFAKLYAVILRVNTEGHGDIIKANSEINRVLNDPLEYHLERLLTVLKLQNVRNFFEHKNIFDPLLNMENHESYSNLFPEITAENMKVAFDAWNKETLEAHFVNTVNQSILCFKK